MAASVALDYPRVGKRSHKTKARKANGATLTAQAFERLTVIGQVHRAFMPGARMAACVGLVIGGFVPVATFTLIHKEFAAYHWLAVLILGGLVYSAKTVFTWGRAAFGDYWKAGGFCVLLEGILTFAHTEWLAFAALIVLVFINAVSAACALQIRK